MGATSEFTWRSTSLLYFEFKTMLNLWRWIRRGPTQRRWRRPAFISLIILIGTCVLGSLLITSLPKRGVRLQELDSRRPVAYTKLGKCQNTPNGDIDCPDIRQLGSTPLRKAQLVLTRILRIFDLIAKKHGIKYWLTRGSLLGAIRHGGHNPFDDDIDICIPKADFEKFVKYGLKELPDDIFFQTEDTDVFYKIPPQSGMLGKLRDTKSCYKYCLRNGCKFADGLQLDMLVLETDSDGNFLNLFSHSSWFVRRFIYGPLRRKRTDIFPLVVVNFDGFALPAPREWRKLLTSSYGDFMRIPYEKPLAHKITDALRSCEEIEKLRL